MVIDSSAILAVYFDEPAAFWVEEQIATADRALISTVNLAETLMRIYDKHPTRASRLETQLLTRGFQFIPPDTLQAQLAARARFQFPLNLGDCFAYALAKTQNLPLLTLDTDFRRH